MWCTPASSCGPPRYCGATRHGVEARFAQRLGKGVIFGSAHLGPVALVGQILMHRGYTLTLPAEKTDSEFMHAVNRARQAQGLVLVPMDSALGIHRVIRDGGVLTMRVSCLLQPGSGPCGGCSAFQLLMFSIQKSGEFSM